MVSELWSVMKLTSESSFGTCRFLPSQTASDSPRVDKKKKTNA